MNSDQVQAVVLELPLVAKWPDLTGILKQAMSHPRQDWELPLLALRAVGGDENLIPPASAALICIQLSITLVDDILDDDPRGAHLKYGNGATANIAQALQAIAFHLIAALPVAAERRSAVIDSLAQMAFGTAFGQSLDVQNLQGEENYWKVVRAKSTPFYGAGLQIGALLGQASPELAAGIYEFGALNGEIIQIYDDLTDALRSPANPDWKRTNNNLAILYALTAQHPERADFLGLLPQVDRPESLRQAQAILVHSGALSYCVYHVIRRYQAARRILDSLPLVDPAPLQTVLARQIKPVLTLLNQVGAAIPPELSDV